MTQRLPPRETLTVEFNSDLKTLPGCDLIEASACLANADGGARWLGVEDDGTPSGLPAGYRLLQALSGALLPTTRQPLPDCWRQGGPYPAAGLAGDPARAGGAQRCAPARTDQACRGDGAVSTVRESGQEAVAASAATGAADQEW